jgi:ABC-2 type transport system permease protein
MAAVFKREFNAYFTSPFGLVIISIFFCITSLFLFVPNNLTGDTIDMSGVFSAMIFIYAIMIPFITMRLLSEEKKQKTDQCLLTSPVSLTGIVLGKFFSALAFFSITLSYTIVFAIILNAFQAIEVWVFIGNLVGMLLLGSAFISIGLFISSLTENQVVAAIGSLVATLLFLAIQILSSAISGLYSLLPGLALIIPSDTVNNIINYVAVGPRYNNFAMGIFNLADALYFFSIAAVFIFLTVRVLEKRRWS